MAVGEPARQPHRASHFVGRGLPGVLDRTPGPHDLQGSVEPFSVGRPVLQQSRQLLPVGTFVEGIEDGQGVDALLHVLAGFLAQLVLAGDQVHDVVGELEAQAEGLAEAFEQLGVLGGGLGEHAAQRQEVAINAAVLRRMMSR